MSSNASSNTRRCVASFEQRAEQTGYRLSQAFESKDETREAAIRTRGQATASVIQMVAELIFFGGMLKVLATGGDLTYVFVVCCLLFLIARHAKGWN